MEDTNITNPESNSNYTPIPENSATILSSDYHIRFSSAMWFNLIRNQKVLLAGLGGIGSYVGYLLSRLDIEELFLVDPDIVDPSNISGQFYKISDISKYKANALSNNLKEFSNFHKSISICDRFKEDSSPFDIMICGFDNMEARKIFFSKWLEGVNRHSQEDKKKCLFIDGRLAAEEFQIFCIKGDDEYNIKRYADNYLFSDIEAETTICSYKQTSFTANMIASVMVNLFVNFIANRANPIIDRDLPFYTLYNAEFMFFKTER